MKLVIGGSGGLTMFEFLFGKKKKNESEELRSKQVEDFDQSFSGERGFSFPIEDVFSISGRGIVVTGKVESGQISVGDKVQWLDSTGTSKAELTILGVEMFRKILDTARKGDSIGLLVKGVSDKSKIARGDKLVG